MNKPLLFIIAGPTASGKSALALALAERVNGILVNADSAQVYRDLRFLTARPEEAEEQRAPHRLYGVRDGADPWSAAGWSEAAAEEITRAHERGRAPILVGGTGLYIRTLLEGIAPVPSIDPEIREAVRARPVACNAAELANLDAELASRLSPTDAQRIARALEVRLSTGRSLLAWQAERSGGIGSTVATNALVLTPPKPWLDAQAAARLDRMFGARGEAEARALAARGLDPALPIMRAIGVREAMAWVGGELSRNDALDAASASTRAYVKRQLTWARTQAPAVWSRRSEPLEPDDVDEAAAELASRGGLP